MKRCRHCLEKLVPEGHGQYYHLGDDGSVGSHGQALWVACASGRFGDDGNWSFPTDGETYEAEE